MLLHARLKPIMRRAQCPLFARGSWRAMQYSSSITSTTASSQPLDSSILYGTPQTPVELQWRVPRRAMARSPSKKRRDLRLKSKDLDSILQQPQNDAVIWQDFSRRIEALAGMNPTESAAILGELARKKHYAALGRTHFFLSENQATKYKKFEPLIKDFNWHIRLAKKKPYSDWSAKKLWSHYQQMKRAMPDQVSRIPEGAWRVLWRTQSLFRPADPNRLANLRVLVEDRTAYGKDVTQERHILRFEEMAHTGNIGEAVEEWRLEFLKNYTQSGNRKEWLELGVRLLALSGDLERGCKLIMWGLRHHKSFDPRSMIFLIHMFAGTGDTGHLRQAWAIYKSIKKHESFVFCTDDYRTLISTFLEGNHVTFALKVVRDLAIDQHLTDKKARSRELQAGLCEVQLRCINQKQLTRISLCALSFLPSDIDWHKFFYDWMRCASQFRSHPFDTCAQIVELMFERGLAPQARHLEQMARQWLRADDRRRQKALEVCWDMINKRLDEVTSPDPLSSAMHYKDSIAAEEHSPAFASRTLPSAGPRTFTLLARYYAQNEQPNDALRALELLSEADLRLNERTVRDILLAQFYLGRPVMTWCVFDEIRKAAPGSINLHAYNILWRTLSKHVTIVNKIFRNHVPSQKNFMLRLCMTDEDGIRMPTPRELFGDMAKYIQQFKQRSTQDGLPQFLLFHTVLTFLKAKDPLAAFVAMRALKERLGLTANLLTLDIIIHYTALRAATVENFEDIKSGKHVDLDSYKDMGYTVLEHIFVNGHTEGGASQRYATNLYDDVFLASNGEAVFNALETYFLSLFQSHWGSMEAVQNYIDSCEQEMGLRQSEEERQEQEVLASMSNDVTVDLEPLTESGKGKMTPEEQEAEEMIRGIDARSIEREVRARWKDMEPILEKWDDEMTAPFGGEKVKEAVRWPSPLTPARYNVFEPPEMEEEEDNLVDFESDLDTFSNE